MALLEIVAGALVKKMVDVAWNRASKKDLNAALGRIYGKWEKVFHIEERQLKRVFEDFFCRKPVLEEIAKLAHGEHARVNLDTLGEQLRESFEWMGASGLGVDMDPEIDEWVRELKAALQ